jgi:hypothetical protein
MEYRDLPDAHKHKIWACVGHDDVAELPPELWTELVRLAQANPDFRNVCIDLGNHPEAGRVLDTLQSICRSVEARISAEEAIKLLA